MWMMKNHMHRQQYGDDDVARKSDYEPLGLSTDKCNNRFISRTLRPMVYKWYMFVCVRMCIYLKLCVYLIRNLIQRCVQFSVSEKPPGEVDLLFAYSFSTNAFAIETHEFAIHIYGFACMDGNQQQYTYNINLPIICVHFAIFSSVNAFVALRF